MSDLAPVLGLLAGIVAVANAIPYVRDVVRGSTRPHRGTWFIWGSLAILVTFSQRADGASWSLLMAVAQASLTGLIFVLSLRRGEGGLGVTDGVAIAIAGAGVAGWMVADEPIAATACVILADLVAAGMMIPKTYREPGSETLSSFGLASLGGALAAGAVGTPALALLLYPVYFCIVNGAIALLIMERRHALAEIGRGRRAVVLPG